MQFDQHQSTTLLINIWFGADDGWANVRPSGTGIGATGSGALAAASSTASSAATMTTGAARMAYGHLAGDEAAKQAGKEAVWGKE